MSLRKVCSSIKAPCNLLSAIGSRMAPGHDSVHLAPKSAGQDALVEVVCAIQCSGKVQD